MTMETKIEWTDFTVNFWEGCQKVGPGCDNCYAEARDIRFTGGSHWGPGAPRRKVKGGIAKLRKINREGPAFEARHGHFPRVFCSSLSDVFDNAVDPAWRSEAFDAITAANNTRIQLLTKRVGNVFKMIPARLRDGGWPQHVGLMITVVNQAEANRDILKLLDLKHRFGIPWVGLSIEPLLGPIDLTRLQPTVFRCRVNALTGVFSWEGGPNREESPSVDWVICGGESGSNARPAHPKWARSLRDQCVKHETPFFFKQWGEWGPDQLIDNPQPDLWMSPDGTTIDGDTSDVEAANCEKPESRVVRMGKRKTGRLLDGREWSEVPQ